MVYTIGFLLDCKYKVYVRNKCNIIIIYKIIFLYGGNYIMEQKINYACEKIFQNDAVAVNKTNQYAHTNFDIEKYKQLIRNEVTEIIKILVRNNLEYELVKKIGWGIVFKFNLNGRKVFTQDYSFKKKKLVMYYWSDEYSCSPCYIKLK